MVNRAWRVAAAELDNQILQVEQHLWTLKYQRNAIVPILQLPDEVLARILIELQHSFCCNDIRSSHSRRRAWAPAMLVCRRFRASALACHVLWAHIAMDDKKLEWLDLCHARSGKLPLDIHGYINAASALEADEEGLVRCVILRARHIRFRVELEENEQYDAYTYVEKPLKPLSALVSLHIDNGDETSSARPSDIFRPFDVEGCIAPVFPSLQRLSIDYIDIDDLCDHGHQLLCHTPNLTSLRIRGMQSPVHEDDFPSLPDENEAPSAVALPLLEHLELSGSLAAVVQTLFILPNPQLVLQLSHSDSVEAEIHSALNDPDGFGEALDYVTGRIAHLLRRVHGNSSSHSLRVEQEGSKSFACLSIRPNPTHSLGTVPSVYAKIVHHWGIDIRELLPALSRMSVRISGTSLNDCVWMRQVATPPLHLTIAGVNRLPVYHVTTKRVGTPPSMSLDEALERVIDARVEMAYPPIELLTLITSEPNTRQRSYRAQSDNSDALVAGGYDSTPLPSESEEDELLSDEDADFWSFNYLRWRRELKASCEEQGWAKAIRFLQ